MIFRIIHLGKKCDFFVLNIFYKSGERGRERENKNERKRTYIYTGSCAINYIAKVRKINVLI